MISLLYSYSFLYIKEDLYLSTGKMVEFMLNNPRVFTTPFLDRLSEEDATQFLKFFYMTYERFTNRKDTLSLKPNKIYKIQQYLMEKHGKRMLL